MRNSDPPLLDGVEDPFLDPLAEWIGGQWVTKRPTLPGIYWIATREGHAVGLRQLNMVEGEIVDPLQTHNEPGWQGFWWSQPLPQPPKEVPN